MTDMERLYEYRFWVLVVAKYGLLQTALPSILFLELAVVATVANQWAWRRYWSVQTDMTRLDKLKLTAKEWFGYILKRLVLDWVHLCLLAIIGNSLVEGIGRQCIYSIESRALFIYSKLYIFLSVSLMLASFLQQLAYWKAVEILLFGETSQDFRSMKVSTPCRDQIDGEAPGAAAQINDNLRRASLKSSQYKEIFKNGSKASEVRNLFPINDDYKWQPIAIQFALLFCLWGYLTRTESEDNAVAGIMLGFLVQAGLHGQPSTLSVLASGDCIS